MDASQTMMNMSSKVLDQDASAVLVIERLNLPHVICGEELAIRGETCHLLRRAGNPKMNITKEEKLALCNLRADEDLVILTVNKGNATVAWACKGYQS